VTTGQLQHEFEFPDPYRDFNHMGRCRMVIIFPTIGYNKYSELYWPSYAHFKLVFIFGATFRVGSLWRHTLPPCFNRHLLHINQFQHRKIWIGLFGDVPSHPMLCRHMLLHQQWTSWLWLNNTKSLSSNSIC